MKFHDFIWLQYKIDKKMASNIRIEKVCIFCEQPFIAKTTVTKYCSHNCSRKYYKKQKRDEKIRKATAPRKTMTDAEEQTVNSFEIITKRDFLSIKEAATLIGVSESTFYRLMKNKTIKTHKLGGRTIIKRSDIDNLFT